MQNGVPLGEVMAQAIAWCLPRADPDAPATCLRTAQVRQGGPGDGRDVEVEWVTNARTWVDPSLRDVPPVVDAAGLRGGRLLVFLPDESLDDGAAELETRGYFDAHNCPPWDTWVTVAGDSLVTFVPPAFIAAAQRAIDVNPEGCLMWLEDSELFAADPSTWATYGARGSVRSRRRRAGTRRRAR